MRSKKLQLARMTLRLYQKLLEPLTIAQVVRLNCRAERLETYANEMLKKQMEDVYGK